MTDARVAEIAGVLTEAQREAMSDEAVRDGDAIVIRWIRYPGTRCALQDKGLLEPGMYRQDLTPLGLAVRAHLLHPAQCGSLDEGKS